MTRIVKLVVLATMLTIAIKPVHAKSKPSSKKKTLQEYVSTHCKRACVDVKTLKDTVKLMSHRHKVPANLIMAVVKVESRFKKTALASGNYGLMQVNYRSHKRKNLFDVSTNIDVGTEILSDCLEKSKDNIRKALTCYKGNDSKVYRTEVNKAMLVIASLN